VIILTRDEEANLPYALESLRPLGPDIFIVDSGSTDRTVEIARAAGCHVYHHQFENHAAQMNWAIDNLPIETSWVMRLDADERLMPELASELSATLRELPDDVCGLEIKRRVYFWGRWISHGGFYPTWLLRVWRRGLGHCEERWMDEHMLVASGRIQKLSCDLIDENHKGLTFWTDKHNRYADREVRDLIAMEAGSGERPSGQMGRRRWFKENFYGRMPLFWRAFFYWCYRYFIRLGFLDGTPGCVFHFMQGWWYRALVDAKLYEMRLTTGAVIASPVESTALNTAQQTSTAPEK
jgi:glycosyltransferase involved in cell wall biosynthesis